MSKKLTVIADHSRAHSSEVDGKTPLLEEMFAPADTSFVAAVAAQAVVGDKNP